MYPKKSLGQNFLTSIPARNAIIKAGDIKKTDTVLEIGPGKGMLTDGLIKTGTKVIALEKDSSLIAYLNEKFEGENNLSLIEGDALTYTPPKMPYKLIANIPYYITGAILEKYLTENNQPTHIVVLIQKEVATRIVARDKKESILSLSVKAYGEPSIVYKVDKGSFFPKPTVDSAVLCIKNISRKNFINKKQEEDFFKIVKAGFAHKRKILISNLKDIRLNTNWIELFAKNNLDLKVRAEDLRLQDWLNLSRY